MKFVVKRLCNVSLMLIIASVIGCASTQNEIASSSSKQDAIVKNYSKTPSITSKPRNSHERKKEFLRKFDGTTWDYIFYGQTVNGKQKGFWHFKDGRICRVENSKLVRLACGEFKKAFIRTECEHLRVAARERELDKIKHLVKYRGFDINCGSRTEPSVLLAALQKKGTDAFEIVKYLVDAGADVNFRKKPGNSGLRYVTDNNSMSFIAAYQNQIESTAYIVKNGGSFEDAEAGYQARESHDARSAAAWESFKESVGEFLNSAADSLETSREKLGVTKQRGVYKMETEGNYTYVYCNRAPTVANKMFRNDDGFCYEPPSLGAYNCLEVLESLKRQCE